VTAERYAAAFDFHAYVAVARKNVDLWNGTYRTAHVPDDLVARATALAFPWHLLILSEDWCGDAVNTVPVLVKCIERATRLDVRILPRDENLDVMDAHLTSGTRSIPVVMALDERFVEYGWWGPRPATLQRWVRGEGRLAPKEERYRHNRSWYARDRGRTSIEEVLGMLERAERRKREREMPIVT
jgi:hypothetical protein